MSTIRKHRLAKLVTFGVPVALLGALALVLLATLGSGSAPARAAVDPAVNLSLSTTGCDSSLGPTTCTVAPSATFTVSYNVLGQPAAGWAGYDLKVDFAGSITYVNDSLVPPPAGGSGTWPGCAFAVGETPAVPTTTMNTACADLTATNQMFTGVAAKFNMTCGASGSGTITLLGGDANSDLVDESFAAHSEAADETLTINCGAGGGPPADTPTPGGPTPRPPTPTPTRPPAAGRGDVNGDGSVSSVDALWVLWMKAGIIDHVPHPENADLNNDGMINSLDALFILQIAAGLIT